MIERRFCHHDPVEYEYEYRCTEYEYDCPDERWRSAGENGASALHFKEKSERHFRAVASLGSAGFGGGIVLVLSIAVLVLVLETLLGYSVGSLYQSSEHRHDPF